jgi:hypothetical protein
MNNPMVFSNLLNDFTRTNAPTSTIHFKPGNTHTIVGVMGAVSSGSSAAVDLKCDGPADGEPTQSYIPAIPDRRIFQLCLKLMSACLRADNGLTTGAYLV